MASHHDWGIDCEAWCGGTPDDDSECPTPCYLCEGIYDLHTLYALGGVGTRLACRDCYRRDTSEEE